MQKSAIAIRSDRGGQSFFISISSWEFSGRPRSESCWKRLTRGQQRLCHAETRPFLLEREPDCVTNALRDEIFCRNCSLASTPRFGASINYPRQLPRSCEP